MGLKPLDYLCDLTVGTPDVAMGWGLYHDQSETSKDIKARAAACQLYLHCQQLSFEKLITAVGCYIQVVFFLAAFPLPSLLHIFVTSNILHHVLISCIFDVLSVEKKKSMNNTSNKPMHFRYIICIHREKKTTI